MARSGIAVGLNKGHKVTAKEVAPRPSQRKGRATKKATFVRDLIKEVTGLSPYERRIIDLIRNFGDKRARKFAKKRLGSQKRAKNKVEEMSAIIAAARRHN
ncbi:60S ribosomal protein L36 [Brettanomyces bruxellensis]|uniref:60S ribosomal protein L36 n=1 Tax=Dekkera bruxellensis TaxID=5007 RepID=A0A7D9CXY3_DEKBR|nr:60s ribosomal protein l36 [Brettanomyces bruxellensis AWRI1499]KAF6011248.1 60S ribosomal protein L36 [Brettanomyces bruxellensis]VUG16212.1 RPL36A [Brettanomyces bruxellensis]